MKTFCRTRPPSTNGQGFTKLELLVIVGVIALLVGVRLAAANGLKNQTKIAQCASNLRQLALSMLLYGGDNSDRLPSQLDQFGLSAGNWLWDLDWNVGTTLNLYGASQDVMYCPGTEPRFTAVNNDELYEYYAPGRIHVIGYAPTLPGSPGLFATNVNATVTPQIMKSSPFGAGAYSIAPAPASQRVLIADATLTFPGTTNFVNIPGGYRIPHLSAHLDGFLPAGGNVGMLDGHVEWRNFSQMQPRAGSPVFYW
jgi:prepilin-type processing-associated H-X9-DG protein